MRGKRVKQPAPPPVIAITMHDPLQARLTWEICTQPTSGSPAMFSSQAASLQEHKSYLIPFCIFCLTLNILPHNAFTVGSCKAVDFSCDWQKNAGCTSSAYSAHQGRAELNSLCFNRYRPNFNCYRPKASICKVLNRQRPHNQPGDLESIGKSKHSNINTKNEEARKNLRFILSSTLTLM